MTLADETIAYQAYLEGARSGAFTDWSGELDADFAEDLAKARAAIEIAWLEQL